MLKDGQSQDANANAGLGSGVGANDSSQSNPLNLTPKQQAAIAKKAAKLLLREQLKAAGVPFPDDPTPGVDGVEQQGQSQDAKNALALAPPVTAGNIPRSLYILLNIPILHTLHTIHSSDTDMALFLSPTITIVITAVRKEITVPTYLY